MGATVTLDENNLEDGTTRAHIFRYLMSRGIVEPVDTVVDAACGCGMGSAILARQCKKVIGVDIDQDNIDHAIREHMKEGDIEFIKGDLENMALPECDVIISIETIEHLNDPGKFIAEMQNKARRTIFVTVPIGATMHADPTHKSDFTENNFKNLFKDSNWMEYHSFYQGNHLGLILRRRLEY